MPLNKQNLPIPFAVSLDQKTDPWQISPDKMMMVTNAVYNTDKRLTKRNGFGNLSQLPDGSHATTLTTFNDNLTAIGNSFLAYSPDSDQWIDKGNFQPIRLDVVQVVRNSQQQEQVDMAVAENGLSCVVFKEGSDHKYQIFDSTTSQVIVNPITISGTVAHVQVYVLPYHFVIMYVKSVGPSNHLKYIAIPLNNVTLPTSEATLTTVMTGINAPFDAATDGSNLYFAWSRTSTAVSTSFIDENLNQHQTVNYTTSGFAACDILSVTLDLTQSPVVFWVSFHQTGDDKVYSTALDDSLVAILPITLVATDANWAANLIRMTSSAQDNLLSIFTGESATYAYDPSLRRDFISKCTITDLGVVTGPAVVCGTMNLGSKSFLFNENIYMLGIHGSDLQPTYFLINEEGEIIAKLAYQNGEAYPTDFLLPNVWLYDTTAWMGYRFKDSIQAVSKEINSDAPFGIYSLLGINLVSFDMSSEEIVTAEIGDALHIAGGFLWMYDGTQVVEHGFQIYPEDINVTASNAAGTLTPQQYYYSICYEWTDASGNIHRSAPSIPTGIDLIGPNDTITVKVPYLHQTYKTNVRLVLYRWSAGQQIFYQVTSIAVPETNDSTPSSTFLTYVDEDPDTAIIGNNILYTTGGVVENIAAPACNTISLFKSRLMVLNAEDPNVVWFSKQIIQATPVETSDLFTIYVAPTIGVQGSTGDVKCFSALDDKFIMSKQNAFYYMTGNGPDNTGANNDFSEPAFITATVGTTNQQSIAMIPNGLIFKSDKGIWLLDRNLSTNYIGSAVEGFNTNEVVSVINPPGTNQVRICLDNGKVIMYDYYYGRWGTFNNVPSISSVLYNGLHTYLMSTGQIRQETPGAYLDGSSQVLMSFTTAWMNLAGLQGYERFYFLYIIGEYLSPNKLQVEIAYDYNSSPSQSVLITANNGSPVYGDDPYYGSGSPYGGPTTLEQWRIFAKRQRCQAFQVTVQEVFDGSEPIQGAGLTFSGLNLVYGLKKGFRPISSSLSKG